MGVIVEAMGNQFVFDTKAASSRTHSEDRAEVFEYEDVLIVVVADGAGGLTGGAAASDALVNAVRARIGEQPFDPYNMRAWVAVLSRADSDIARGAAGGETTAIVAVIGPAGVIGVSAGDSEAWMVGSRTDRLTEKQDRTRIGTGQARPTPFHRRTMDGVLVIATDGLFRHTRSDSIAASCGPGTTSDIASRLVDLPRLRSGAYPDDLAVVVVGVRPRPSAEQGQ
jgi:serine/threonine protein phosphatase PrpC